MLHNNPLLERAKALKLYGLIEHWVEVCEQPWIPKLLEWEERQRVKRSLQRRFDSAKLAAFKPLSEFDWSWPKICDQKLIEELSSCNFIKENMNIILCGPNGVGKTTIAKNIAYQSVSKGHTALFTTAADMLNALSIQDGDNALRRRLKYYANPDLLVIDEVGYLSYGTRHADLLFAIISQRYEKKATLVTTNRVFAEWGEIFPNAACVVSLIDRLVHNSEIINIEADSFRLRESKERKSSREKKRNTKTEEDPPF